MKDNAEIKEMFLKSLSDSQCEKIHAAALEILQETGVIFQNSEARDIMKKGGCKIDGEKVFVPASLVEWALQQVPPGFTLYDQLGNAKHEVTGRNCIYGPGSDCLNILDHRTGKRRDPLNEDHIELIKICDSLENTDFLMSMVIPTDVPENMADRIQMQNMLNYSTKPIIAVSFSHEGTQDIIAMAEKVAGSEESLQKNPFIVHYIQPVRALVQNEDALLKMMHTVKKGLPCLYLVSAIMGFSGPVTAAGYQAMGAAGQLSTLVLSQLIREGNPFIVRGGRIVVADMKSMLFTFADPCNRIFSAEMAHYYNLPSFGTAGCSDSKQVDFQAVSEASLTLLADALAGANLIHDVGYIESGVTYSAQMLVLCDEIINWIKAFKQGAPVNQDTLALEQIDKLGFDGDFITDEHTLAHYREQWESNGTFDRDTYRKWQEEGSSDIKERIAGKIEGILSQHQCRVLPDKIQSELDNIANPS